MTSSIPHLNIDDESATLADDLPPACTFTLGGKTWTVRNKDLIPFAAIYQATAATEVGMPLAVGPFFSGALEPGEVESFLETLGSPKVTLPMAVRALTQVVGVLYGRPTVPSVTSQAGRKRTGRKSAGGSSSAAIPRQASGN